MDTIRVLIADDHPLIVEGLATALLQYGIDVAGHATAADAVINKYAACMPDVAVLDVRFGEGTTGLDVARDLLKRFPEARILFFSQFDDDELIREAYRMGGASFITKDAPTSVLADAIRQVHSGKTHFLNAIAERFALIELRGSTSPLAKLDARELEVFKLMALGKTHSEIAERMSLSPKTIANTSQALKERLGLHRQADITLMAVRHRLIEA